MNPSSYTYAGPFPRIVQRKELGELCIKDDLSSETQTQSTKKVPGRNIQAFIALRWTQDPNGSSPQESLVAGSLCIEYKVACDKPYNVARVTEAINQHIQQKCRALPQMAEGVQCQWKQGAIILDQDTRAPLSHYNIHLFALRLKEGSGEEKDLLFSLVPPEPLSEESNKEAPAAPAQELPQDTTGQGAPLAELPALAQQRNARSTQTPLPTSGQGWLLAWIIALFEEFFRDCLFCCSPWE